MSPTQENQGDGKGPRWLGDNLPNIPPELQHAQSLPPVRTPTHILFFGFEGPEPECCLQQWYPSPFTETTTKSTEAVALKFKTSEQYMMYHKAVLMGDAATAEKILQAETPGEAKKLGREVKGFDQGKWDGAMDGIVEEGNYLKFSQDERLRQVLLGTEEREIVETSPNDRLWGVGFNSEEALDHVSEWGENKLGKALMRVRERLRTPLVLN